MTRTKKFYAAAILTAIFALSALPVFFAQGGGDKTAFAEKQALAGAITQAPLAYSYQGSGDSGYYRVEGVDAAAAADLDAETKKKLTVVIPATYNDQTNGEAPVQQISSSAFSKGTHNGTVFNQEYDFIGLNLRGASNLKFIDPYAFYKTSITGELYIPKNVSSLGTNAFSDTKVTSLVFDEQIGRINVIGALTGITTLDSATVHIPENFLAVRAGRIDYTNVFFSSSIGSFTVDEKNPNYYAREGVLYQKNREDNLLYLSAYPTGKNGVTRIEQGTTHIADRAFIGGTGTVIFPDSVKNFDAFAVFNFKGSVLFETTDISSLTLNNSATPDSSFSNSSYLVFRNKALRDAAIAEGGFLHNIVTSGNYLSADRVGYLTGIQAAAKTGASFSADMTAEQIEEGLTFTAAASTGETGAVEHNFDLTGYAEAALPAGGLVAGENTISLSYGGVTGSVTIDAAAPTLASIEAVFAPPDGAVYTSASLDSLKSRITVTGTSALGADMGEITDFTLTGTLAAGDSKLTVSVGGVTTEVTIPGVIAVALETITAEVSVPANVKLVEGMTAEEIKGYIVVNAANNDGSRADASEAVISIEGGELKAGANTVTVMLGGKSDSVSINAQSKAGGEIAGRENKGLSGGAIAGIVIAVIFGALILGLLALFFFRKDKSISFKEFYAGLWGKCAAAVRSRFKKDAGRAENGGEKEEPEGNDEPPTDEK